MSDQKHKSVDHCDCSVTLYSPISKLKLSLDHRQHRLSFNLYDKCTRSQTNKQLKASKSNIIQASYSILTTWNGDEVM